MSSVGAEWVQDGALVQKRKVGLVASRWSSGTALGGQLVDPNWGPTVGLAKLCSVAFCRICWVDPVELSLDPWVRQTNLGHHQCSPSSDACC